MVNKLGENMNIKCNNLALALVSSALLLTPLATLADSGRICTQSTTGTTGSYYVADNNKGNVRSLSGEVCWPGGCLPVFGSMGVANGQVEISTRGAEQVVSGTSRSMTTHSAHTIFDPVSLTGTGMAIVTTSVNGATPTTTASAPQTVNVVTCPAESVVDEKATKATIGKMIAGSK